MIVYLYFLGNDSAQYTHSGTGGTVTCPNGIMARLYGEAPSAIRSEITIANASVVIFQKVEEDVIDGVIEIGSTTLKMIFDTKNTTIVLHDHCYEDFYKDNGNTKTVYTFVKDSVDGTYVYDKDSASFIDYVAGTHGTLYQKYSKVSKTTKIQDKGQKIDASFTTSDIVFADYAVTDKPVDVYVNAGISLAGLKLTWSSDTNTESQDTKVSFNLGDKVLTGSFENSPVKYSGQRFMKSIKLMPASRNCFAVRYEVFADFINNGYDDIEVYDFNILTEQILGEIGGENA
jgi:hypothetical protein